MGMCYGRLMCMIRSLGWCVAILVFCFSPTDRRAVGTGSKVKQLVRSPAPEPLHDRYALIVGVNASADERTPALQFAESDAVKVYETLTDPRIGRFDPNHAWLLTGKQANVANLRRYFSRLRNVGKNDLVFIYFSGHGAKEGGEAFWVTSDTEMNNLPGTALSNTELKLFLKRIPSERVVVALDCCYAEATLHASRSLRSNFSTLWRSFADKGRIVLAGAGRTQEAVETESLQQGVFTHFLIRGLKGEADTGADGIITAGELWRYLNTHVSEQAARVEGFQAPTLLAEPDTPVDQFLLAFDTERFQNDLKRIEKLVAMRSRGELSAREFDEGRRLLSTSGLRGREQQRREIYAKLADGKTDVETARLALLALAPETGMEGFVEPAPPHWVRQFRNTIRMDMILVPAGTFQMGSKLMSSELSAMFGGPAEWFDHEQPRHLVRITKPFYMGIHEVTVGQFRQFVEETGYRTEAEIGGQAFEGGKRGGYTLLPDGNWGWNENATWRDPGFRQKENHPVVLVSWNDAQAFCRWLSTKDDRVYRLPTEAEWEHACRAGTTTLFWWGDDPQLPEPCASSERYGKRFSAVALPDGGGRTGPVGCTGPNPFGLYDMTGGVWEWCNDYYARDYYAYAPMDDPQGPDHGIYRVIRGGCWTQESRYLRSARRNGYRPSGRHGLIGFRVVCTSY